MEYFVLQDLGYDGIYVSKFINEQEAVNFYNKTLKEENEYNSKFNTLGNDKSIYGRDRIVLIEGNVLLNNKFEF